TSWNDYKGRIRVLQGNLLGQKIVETANGKISAQTQRPIGRGETARTNNYDFAIKNTSGCIVKRLNSI
ncbi:MAG: hypothetical protein J5700_06030, partial [Treponema sp.]|nr:hypothetical protein [Treponema sp.]